MTGALLGGVLGGAAFWGGAWGVLIWIAFVPLYHVASTRGPKAAFALGWLFGTAYWCVGAYWTYAPAALLMETSLPRAILASVPLLLFWGLPWGAAAAAASWSGFPRLLIPMAVSIEAFWPHIYPPYTAVALADHLPAIQSLSLFGMGGVSFLVHGFNAAVFTALSFRRWRPLAAAILLVIANEGFGRRSMARVAAEDASGGKRLRVAVLQGAVSEALRWKPERYKENLAVYRELLESVKSEKPDLAVFPQSTYERIWTYGKNRSDWETEFQNALRADFPVDFPMVLGTRAKRIVRYRGKTAIVRRHHASVLARRDGRYGGHSEKRDPTPFSEWMPGARWFPGLRALSPGMDRIHRGTLRVLTLEDGTILAPLICYDAVKPWNARRLAARAEPDLLLLQSSDSWADGEQMPRQNLRIAVLRAVENRTPVVRAVTSGVSASIDRAGRIRASLPFGARGAFVSVVPTGRRGSWYTKIGNAAYFSALALSLLGLLGAGFERLVRYA